MIKYALRLASDSNGLYTNPSPALHLEDKAECEITDGLIGVLKYITGTLPPGKKSEQRIQVEYSTSREKVLGNLDREIFAKESSKLPLDLW